MSAEIVHPVPVEEVAGWVKPMATTFLEEPESERTDGWAANHARSWRPERTWGARDGDRWVATLRTMPRTITVPGRDGATELLAADALTSVTVAATHRRRGLLTRMLDDSLREAHERGDAISILVAAEWPIYGRFGYAPATLAARHHLHRRRPGASIEGDPGRVRQVDREEFARLAPAVFDAARRHRAGNVDRDGPWWDQAFGLDGWHRQHGIAHNFLVHDGDAGVDGLLAWETTREAGWGPTYAEVRAEGLTAVTDGAHRDLWAYLSGLDLVETITMRGPVDEPARWLLADGRALVTTDVSDFLWCKLLDVPAALGARGYAVDGEIVFELTDETSPSVAGRYRLAVAGDRVEVTQTRADPDLTLAQTALASAYLGGFTLREQRLAATVSEHTPGALTLADAMFATALAPYAATGF